VDGIHYKNISGTYQVEFVQTEEGRAIKNGNNNSGTANYIYQFTLSDHLGNNRVTIQRDPVTQNAELLESTDYYPFGMATIDPKLKKNKYLYNKKENQEELEELDYGARFYDPVIGRFTTIDPSADDADQETTSPYAYVGNNPVSRIDPDGRIWFVIPFIPAIIEAVVATAAVGTIVVGTAGVVKSYQNRQQNNTTVQSKSTEPSTKTNNQKLRESAKVGQEAHRQEQKKLKEEGAQVEVPMKLKDGTNVRKDAVKEDGTAVIIKPDTESGKKSAEKREKLMEKNGVPTEKIFYDPKNPAYQPGSPTYIGPKKQ